MLFKESVSLIQYQHLHSLQLLNQFLRFTNQLSQPTRCSDNNMWIFLKLLILHAIVHSSNDQSLPEIDTLSKDIHLLMDLHSQL